VTCEPHLTNLRVLRASAIEFFLLGPGLPPVQIALDDICVNAHVSDFIPGASPTMDTRDALSRYPYRQGTRGLRLPLLHAAERSAIGMWPTPALDFGPSDPTMVTALLGGAAERDAGQHRSLSQNETTTHRT
jgi:hypothetical protein